MCISENYRIAANNTIVLINKALSGRLTLTQRDILIQRKARLIESLGDYGVEYFEDFVLFSDDEPTYEEILAEKKMNNQFIQVILDFARLPVNDSLMIKAVAAYLALGICADAITINSYFEVWGLGKSDLSDYSEYYQDVVQCECSLGVEDDDDYQDDNLNWAGFDDVAKFPDVVVYHFDRVKKGEESLSVCATGADGLHSEARGGNVTTSV